MAAYCRVSSSSDNQIHSFATQIRYYSEYAKKHHEYQIVDIYADEGMSGTEMKKRDEFNRLLRDCRNGKIDRIIVKSISRMSRNTEELLVTLRMLKDIGVTVYFEEQGIDTDKLNMEMIVTFPGMAAQQESEAISGNMRWSYKKRMESGDFNCTCPAYGYSLDNGEMVINETEATVIRNIFDMYLKGMGIQSIANKFTWTKNGTKKIVWRCINRLDYGKKYCHNSPSVEESALQSAIMNAIMDTAMKNKDIMKILKLHIGMVLNKNDTIDNSLDIQMRIAEIDAEFTEMLKAVSAETAENFDENRVKELMDEKSELQQRLCEIALEKEKHETMQSRLDDMYLILDGLKNHPINYDDSIVRQLLECVVVESKNKIKVVFKDGYEVEQEM